MISVVIATFNDERTLGQALAALVPAAVDGLVREVILADAGSTDATLAIADDAGARVVPCEGPAEARLADGCRIARADWLLVLDPATVLPQGWEDAAADHLNQGGGKAASWGDTGLWPFSARAAPALLVPRRLYEGQGLKRLSAGARRLKIARRT